MRRPLSGVKVAMLVANGFSQSDMIAAHKALLEAGANVRIVSSENGLVNGWEGESWGHHFAVDAPLGTALGADYSVLVIPGGQRSVEKLNLTAHTKRFISSFMGASKPVFVMDNALHILILTDNIKGRTVSGPATMQDVVTQAGGTWSGDAICVDGQLSTGPIDNNSRAAFIAAMMNQLAGGMTAEQAA